MAGIRIKAHMDVMDGQEVISVGEDTSVLDQQVWEVFSYEIGVGRRKTISHLCSHGRTSFVFVSMLQNPTWVMCHNIIRCFQPSMICNPFGILLGMKQEGLCMSTRINMTYRSGCCICYQIEYLKVFF